MYVLDVITQINTTSAASSGDCSPLKEKDENSNSASWNIYLSHKGQRLRLCLLYCGDDDDVARYLPDSGDIVHLLKS